MRRHFGLTQKDMKWSRSGDDLQALHHTQSLRHACTQTYTNTHMHASINFRTALCTLPKYSQPHLRGHLQHWLSYIALPTHTHKAV